MIARVWEGKTKIEHSETYQKIIEERDIPDYKGTDGFIKLTFLKYSNQDHTYFKLLTFWSGLDAITNFTGPNIEEAKFYEEDQRYLADFPGKVSHYTVFAE